VTNPEPAVAAALARLYDVDLQEDPGDLDLYLAMAARTGGPILELGVGSGRIAVPVAGAGYEVTGVDLDPAMLARARERARAAGPAAARNLRLVEGDARTLADGLGRFKLAVVALNSLLVFGDHRDQRRVLRAMADHLEPGGIALVDVWLPDAEDLGRYDGRLGLEYLRRDPEQGTLVSKLASAVYDAATATVELTAIYDEGRQGEPSRRWLREDRLRLVTADELRSFAEDAGLTIEVIAGGYNLDPIRPGDDRAVLVAHQFEGQGAPVDIASAPPGRGTRPAPKPGGGPALV
jgi:SAM-dependent methyltransferase